MIAISRWTELRARKSVTVALSLPAAAMLFFPLAMPRARAAEEPRTLELPCQTGSVCNQVKTGAGSAKMAVKNRSPVDPYTLYTLEGSEEGYVSGISPSADNQLVKFGVFGVPDNFPWGEVVRIQKFKIDCARPVGGAYSRIEGSGSNLTKYWNVTCRILGAA
ncbi:MAG: hypothetical protein ACRYGI_08095 [Janthinobacterium lividum]